MRVATIMGADAVPHMAALGRLRRQVFRDWPYLYDGTDMAEAAYTATYETCPRAGLVVAWDGAERVGMATCLPMADEDAHVQAPFTQAGLPVEDWFYFGESVLLPAYRGQGVGVAFFQHREAHARSFGAYRHATFCAVQRPADHPLRPPGAKPLDGFWRNRGYAPLPGIQCTMRWRDLTTGADMDHAMQFWGKAL